MARQLADMLRTAMEALNQGDVQTFLDLHADDVVVHVTGRNAYSGTFTGKGELASAFENQAKALDGPPQFEVHDVLASEAHGIMLGVQLAARGGRTLQSRTAIIAHERDGKFSEIWVIPEDPYAEDEFYS